MYESSVKRRLAVHLDDDVAESSHLLEREDSSGGRRHHLSNAHANTAHTHIFLL